MPMADQDDLIDFGEEPADPAVTALEQKYSKQMRQIVSQKIDLPISTLPNMIKDQINLNPDFQRRDRWDQEKQSRFIESIIMNVPIPPVFLGEKCVTGTIFPIWGMHLTPVAPTGCALRFPRPAGDQFGWHGIKDHRLLDEAIEQFTPGPRSSAVESE